MTCQESGKGGVGGEDNVLLPEIFGDSLRSQARDFHPDLGKGGRHGEQQDSIEEDMERIK